MEGYRRIGLKQLLQLTNEDPESTSLQSLKDLLSAFSCRIQNDRKSDVEEFLHTKAIEFERQGIAATHLVMASHRGNLLILGYFTLAPKYVHVELKNNRYRLGSKLKQRLKRFGVYEESIKAQIISMPLIGQLGKNYTNGYNELISGGELLQIACDTVKESQALIGGRTVYLECEDTPRLIQFYEENGFTIFGRRELEAKEDRYFKGEYLVQLMKYL